MRQNLTIFGSIIMILLSSCNTKKQKEKESAGTQKALFNLLTSAQSGLDFTNVLEETTTQNIYSYQYFYNGAGVGIGDIDNDSLPDICFASNQGPCQLFLNKGQMKFQNITAASKINTTGWSTGIAMADVNGDGWLDIYICRSEDPDPAKRTNLLYINNHDRTFSEEAEKYGINDNGYASQAYFFDFDRDNDLDLFICNHPYTWDNKIEKQAIQNATVDRFATDRLYRNDENKFTEITTQAGVHSFAFSLSAAIADYNNDGWPDIYVCNDYTMNDFLYINNHDGTFTDKVFDYFPHTSFYSMGSDMGDVNNDGRIDLVTLDMLPEDQRRQRLNMMRVDYDKYMAGVKWGFGYAYMYNNLQLNTGNNHFSEIGQLAGIEASDWSWSPLLQDFNNDGFVDLYVTNGYKRDFTNFDFIVYENEQARSQSGKTTNIMDLLNTMPSIKINNYLYLNNGDLTFKNATAANNMAVPSFSQGAAYADLDRDGDLDIVVNNINDNAFLFENNSQDVSENHFINIVLNGTGKNTGAIGALVSIKTDNGTCIRNNMPVRGYLSTSDPLLHFGLGKSDTSGEVTITWPDGKQQIETNLKTDQVNYISYQPTEKSIQKLTNAKNIFVNTTERSGINFRHQENNYIDFKREPLLPHMFSQNGPGLATGDINGDGMDDVFIGGSLDQSGKIFIQQPNGSFNTKSSTVFIQKQKTDDMGCLLFDADNDGDNDLYIVSGGNEYDSVSKYNDQLFLNDGKGNFVLSKNSLPVFNSSGSCVVAGDFDQDGDQDLFRGGRIIPGKYPESPRSFLLKNENGKFSDVTALLAPDLLNPGLVCSALFTDFDNSGTLDLLVVGEWMPIMVMKNENGKFVNQTQNAGLNKSNGWWNSISGGDFDNDGNIDYLVGNRGLNSRIRANSNQPACITYKDFDSNGSLDAIMCYYYPDGKSYPIVGRDEFIDQMRGMKKRLLRYDDFAGKTLSEIVTPDELSGAKVVNAYTFSSVFMHNKGNGTFELRDLPVEVQFSSVYGILTGDFNKDGNEDALLSGNFYGNEVNLGRFDASTGIYLIGDGSGEFSVQNGLKSGFLVTGNSRGSAILVTGNKAKVVVSNSNDKTQVFEIPGFNQTDFKWIDCKPNEVRITYNYGGKKRIKECYYGSGYQSSSSRKLFLPSGASDIVVYETTGKARKIK